MRGIKFFAPVFVLGALPFVSQAQVGVDGVLGSEWTSVTPVSAIYDSSAPTSNFGAPTNRNHTVAYDIYARSDNNYIYGFALAKPQSGDAYNPTLNFWNLYIDTDPFVVSGSDVGFEFFNDQAFKPGVPGVFTGLAALGVSYARVNEGVEFAIPWTYFYNDPQSIGFTKVTNSSPNNYVRFNLSQAWGYSVIGGDADYGFNRLGLLAAPVPEPATMAALGFGALALLRRRRK